MNKEDIIRMAREAGMVPVHFNRTAFDTEMSVYTPELERFSALVAAHERQEFAQHAVEIARMAIKQEREECAKIADEYGKVGTGVGGFVAEAIRARGNT